MKKVYDKFFMCTFLEIASPQITCALSLLNSTQCALFWFILCKVIKHS